MVRTDHPSGGYHIIHHPSGGYPQTRSHVWSYICDISANKPPRDHPIRPDILSPASASFLNVSLAPRQSQQCDEVLDVPSATGQYITEVALMFVSPDHGVLIQEYQGITATGERE